MAQDNTRPDFMAYAVTESGERFEWRGLRYRQAKWRQEFLARGMLWRGKPLAECGFELDPRRPA
jgi:hypothetical protein